MGSITIIEAKDALQYVTDRGAFLLRARGCTESAVMLFKESIANDLDFYLEESRTELNDHLLYAYANHMWDNSIKASSYILGTDKSANVFFKYNLYKFIEEVFRNVLDIKLTIEENTIYD